MKSFRKQASNFKKHNVRQKNKEAAKRTMTAASSIIIMFSFPFDFV